jgi:hypothetical protein
MEVTLVYPPMGGGEFTGVRLYESLDHIPASITHKAGYRAYTITIPNKDHINDGHGFYAQVSPREVLEAWDRRRSPRAQAGRDPGAVLLLSAVAGVPAANCKLINNPDEPLLFRVASPMDVRELWHGEKHRSFSPPITLQPELYTLDAELMPVLWQTVGKSAR